MSDRLSELHSMNNSGYHRVCEECKFAAESDSRYEAHLKEPRHVNYYRNLAYMQPKKRQVGYS